MMSEVREQIKSPSLIQSYVRGMWFVSTIKRRCSAMVAHDMTYFETIVWEWDHKTKKSGKMVAVVDSGMDLEAAYKNHVGICHTYLNEPDVEASND